MTSRTFAELTAGEFHDVVRLRCEVFVVEQACVYPELDGRDTEPDTEHHWLDHDGSIVTCARTLVESDGSIRIGRVATSAAHRGKGHAAGIVRALIDRFDGRMIVLDAQSHLAGWYERLGFTLAGEEFVEDGIPHVPMRRAPADTA